ncbi:sodium/calcium exchanger NCL1-like [Prosopis cineraria]|uniref:sodium/calcium exchanger NCL1-like n=1 Tax=Prosopis cineraria TaxID=364024 RepID=UPI0024104D4D|nr:sodium/calcium exchanger NCL1-like [Prosopis cineraria]
MIQLLVMGFRWRDQRDFDNGGDNGGPEGHAIRTQIADRFSVPTRRNLPLNAIQTSITPLSSSLPPYPYLNLTNASHPHPLNDQFSHPMSRRFSFTLSLSLSLSLLILCAQVRARFLSSSSDLVSDGIHDFRDSPEDNLLRFSLPLTESTCDQTYGFLPCTTSVVGNLFLIIVYGFLMYKAATYLSCGSELLLEILGPGIVGGLFLPILGALPDAMLILGVFRLCSFSISIKIFFICSISWKVSPNFPSLRTVS